MFEIKYFSYLNQTRARIAPPGNRAQMLHALLMRSYQEAQTLGSLTVYHDYDQLFTCKTLELANKGNAPGISCILEDEYITRKHVSPKFGACFWLQDVIARLEILMHYGSFTHNSRGCILVGRQHVKIDSDELWDLNYSRDTLKELYKLLPEIFVLKIISRPLF